MDWIFLLPILAFVALAAGLGIVFRRTGFIVAKTREAERFRSSVKDLVARIDTSLSGAVARIDQLRHHELNPASIDETLTATTDAVDRYIEEARALRGPHGATEIRDELVASLERAGRALETVEHGANIMTSVRGSHRELEAQTSIKRGYLNLVHAREAIVRQATLADALETPHDHTM
jgi:hypothetical protein